MKVTVSQTLDFEELPGYLMELTDKIGDILVAECSHILEDGVCENLRQERFLAAASALDDVRISLSRVDVKVAELQKLCVDYQSALLKMESLSYAEQNNQESPPQTEQAEGENDEEQ